MENASSDAHVTKVINFSTTMDGNSEEATEVEEASGDVNISTVTEAISSMTIAMDGSELTAYENFSDFFTRVVMRAYKLHSEDLPKAYILEETNKMIEYPGYCSRSYEGVKSVVKKMNALKISKYQNTSAVPECLERKARKKKTKRDKIVDKPMGNDDHKPAREDDHEPTRNDDHEPTINDFDDNYPFLLKNFSFKNLAKALDDCQVFPPEFFDLLTPYTLGNSKEDELNRFKHIFEMGAIAASCIKDFYSRILGIGMLPWEDADSIVNIVLVRVLILWAAMKYDIKTDSIMFPNNQPHTRESFLMSILEPMTHPLFEFCKNMWTLGLDKVEYALFTVLICLSEKSETMRNPVMLAKLNLFYHAVLCTYIAANRAYSDYYDKLMTKMNEIKVVENIVKFSVTFNKPTGFFKEFNSCSKILQCRTKEGERGWSVHR